MPLCVREHRWKNCCVFVFPAETLTGSSQAESAALAQFNKSWAELTDWLTMLDNMVQNKQVVVADLEDINENISSLKVEQIRQTLLFVEGTLSMLMSLSPSTILHLNHSLTKQITNNDHVFFSCPCKRWTSVAHFWRDRSQQLRT